MRILVVHESYMQPGGEDRVFHAEVRLLRDYQHDVAEFTLDNAIIPGMNRISLGLKTIWNQRACRQLRQVIRCQRPAVVHFHNTFPLISPVTSRLPSCSRISLPARLGSSFMSPAAWVW